MADGRWQRSALGICLAALVLVLPCQRASAPLPIYLGLALKCIGIGTIAATGVIICRCEPDYYLIRVQEEGELPFWLVSQASAATVKKNEGWRRCEGPFKDRTEPDFRAWCNNRDPLQPMFPCGPLGTIPSAVRTNYVRVTLQQSVNGGGSWAAVGAAVVDPEDNWSFALLPRGTNGLSAAQLYEVRGCTVTITNSPPAAIQRVVFEATEETP